MKVITLPTSPETRAKLTALRATLSPASDGNIEGWSWFDGNHFALWSLALTPNMLPCEMEEQLSRLPLRLAREVAEILGARDVLAVAAGLASYPDRSQSTPLDILAWWERHMDHPEQHPEPLEIHHADIWTLRSALLGESPKEDSLSTVPSEEVK